ncbi:MAG: cyclic nucleotide-binding domain-containing protein [Myxococcota bacterium]
MYNSHHSSHAGGGGRPVDSYGAPARYGAPDPGELVVHEGAAIWGHHPPIHHVPAHTPVYKQGSQADVAYIVVRGKFQLVRENAVRRSVVGTIEQGAWLAVPELLNHRPYASSAVAQEPSVVIPVNRELFQRLLVQAPGLTSRALVGVSKQALGLLESLEAQVLDQTFLGLTKGLELVMAGRDNLPESQLLTRLRDLFALPNASLLEALKVLESLNLIKRQAQPGREAVISLTEPTAFPDQVKRFADQWKGRLPGLVASEPPREAFRLEELCESLGVKPPQFLRRMTLPDFPLGILRFDPEGVEALRKTQGDLFFKKKVSGKELLQQLQSIEELIDVEPDLLRDIMPKLDLPRLIKLLAGVDSKLRDHLMNALSARTKRMVTEELNHVGSPSSHEMGDLEAELLKLCRGGS